MIDREHLQLMIYQHVVQLTLLDHPIPEAFDLAYEVAARAFDDGLTDVSLMLARQALGVDDEGAGDEDSPDEGQPVVDGNESATDESG